MFETFGHSDRDGEVGLDNSDTVSLTYLAKSVHMFKCCVRGSPNHTHIPELSAATVNRQCRLWALHYLWALQANHHPTASIQILSFTVSTAGPHASSSQPPPNINPDNVEDKHLVRVCVMTAHPTPCGPKPQDFP